MAPTRARKSPYRFNSPMLASPNAMVVTPMTANTIPKRVPFVILSLKRKWETAATNIGSTWTNKTELETDVKLRLVIQNAKCKASAIPIAIRLRISLIDDSRICLNPLDFRKKGRRITVAKMSLYAAIAREPALLIFMRMDAVDTAIILIKSASFGGNPGFSLTAYHR